MASDAEALVRRGHARGGLFLRSLMAVGAGAIVALFFVVAPKSLQSSGAVRSAAVESSKEANSDATVSALAGGAATQATSVGLPGPTAIRAVSLYSGPSQDEEFLGSFPKWARLEVVGRSGNADWLAVLVVPGSALYGWVRAADVAGVLDLAALEVLSPVSISR